MSKQARFPMHPYPTSWYRMMNADQLAPGEVVELSFFGRSLAAFRDADGTPHVLDAHCAHLGANLAVGGRVEGCELVCPFHGWRFDGTGACTAMAYPGRVPSRARVRSYPTREINGLIIAFYDELGREPTWEVPEIPGYHDLETFTEHAWKTWRIRTHVQEVFENGPDGVHQLTLHCALEFPTWSAEPDGVFFRGEFGASYEAGADLPDAVANQVTRYIDAGLGFTHAQLRLDYDGLIVEREIQFCLTPIDDEYIDASLSTRMRRLEDPELTALIQTEATFHTWRSFEEDIPIWENKSYLPLPGDNNDTHGNAVLCEADKDLIKLRQWARQFYPATPGEQAVTIDLRSEVVGAPA